LLINLNRNKVAALSIVYPGDDPHLGFGLEKLRRYLRDGVVLFVGGRVTESYRKILDAIGAVYPFWKRKTGSVVTVVLDEVPLSLVQRYLNALPATE
jgi:hypothetical protein